MRIAVLKRVTVSSGSHHFRVKRLNMSYIVRKATHKDNSVELSYLDRNNFWRHEKQHSGCTPEQAEATVDTLNINHKMYYCNTLNKCNKHTVYFVLED